MHTNSQFKSAYYFMIIKMINKTMLFIISKNYPSLFYSFNGPECATFDLRHFVLMKMLFEKRAVINYNPFAFSMRLFSNVKYDTAVLKI